MMRMKKSRLKILLTLGILAMLSAGAISFVVKHRDPAHAYDTDTPIKHVVVIFQENVSFDHYFATYPHAQNTTPGEPKFIAKPGTPTVNNLETAGLLTQNVNAFQPFRLGRAYCVENDNDHDYNDEQSMFHAGLMDKFDENNNVSPKIPGQSMAYFDGNTVTALWNYAQHFAMSDNHYGTTFGPSAPGAINLISGQTNGLTIGPGLGTPPQTALNQTPPDVVLDGQGGWTLTGDAQPTGDIADSRDNVQMTGKNIGDLLNKKGITWGWFEGGFLPAGGFTGTGPKHTSPTPSLTPGVPAHTPKVDYIPHHAAFQFYASTANPKHLAPTGTIGETDQANHNYDLSEFTNALNSHHLPAVSFLKAAGYQDGHAGYSDPLAEQTFLVETINAIMASPEWESTAVIILYDDSDGFYDHQMSPIVSQSNSNQDMLLGPGNAGTPRATAFNGRAGYGPRLPFLVISPYARKNYVDHSIIDQSSVIKFIEDNWDLGRIGNQSFDEIAGSIHPMFDFHHGPHPHRLFLDSTWGTPLSE